MIRAFFFDVTGTLTMDDGLRSVACIMGKEKNYIRLNEDYRALRISAEDFIRGSIMLMKGARVDLIREEGMKVNFMDGAEDFVSCLKRKGVKTAIVAKNATTMVRVIAERLGIGFVFGTEIDIEEGKATGKISMMPKGKDEAVRDFMKEHDLKKEECAAIGDEPNDIKMFNEVGIKVTYKGQNIVKEAADYMIDDYAELAPMLERDGLL